MGILHSDGSRIIQGAKNFMERQEKNNKDYYVIDLLQILRTLWKRAWAILLITILFGVIAFGYTVLFVAPKYSSSVMLYVNNSSFTVGGTSVSISASELSAAQSLVDTYIVILNTRTTMEEVIEKTGVDRSYGELLGMVKPAKVTGTEILRVTVTSESATEAQTIAAGIAEVLPGRIEHIIEKTSMRIVDGAVVNHSKVSPNTTTNTAIGMLIGFVASCLLFIVISLLDDTIRNEDYIAQAFDQPILSKIPNLAFDESKRSYAYYRSYGAKPEATTEEASEKGNNK